MTVSTRVRNAASNRNIALIVLVTLLLFAAAVRLQHLVEFVEWPDEIRSMWRTQGDLQSLLIRTPDDWPPLYGMIIWGWVRVVGFSLEGSRFLSALFGILGTALMYRAARYFFREWLPAVLAATVYASIGYLIFEGADVRAYGMALMLGALSFWLTLRWLHNPSWRRGILIAVILAISFYSSFTSILFICYLTGFVLLSRPRAFPKWIVLGIGVAIVSIPILPKFATNAPGRITNRLSQPPPPFLQAMLQVYHDFGGSNVFVVLLGIAALALLWRVIRSRQSRRNVFLLAVWLAVPAASYFALHNNEFLKPRYMWWIALGLALFIGYAVIRLPKLAQALAIAAFALLTLVPVNFDNYRIFVTATPPFRDTLSWFSKNLRPGDVLVIDPNCACGDAYAWDYFVPQYFPTGYLPIVQHPGSNPRVWYLSTTSTRDDALYNEVLTGRKASTFIGPWFFLLRLYEGPPHPDGVAFGDKIRLNGVEIANNNVVMAKDEPFQVRLWWSAAQPLDRDYSFSVAVIDSQGRLVTQLDGPPIADDTPKQTSAWKVGTTYDDFRDMQLPANLDDGTYRLVVTVYQWWDGVRLIPAANPYWTSTSDSYLVLMPLTVVS